MKYCLVPAVVRVHQHTQNLVIWYGCFAEDGKEQAQSRFNVKLRRRREKRIRKETITRWCVTGILISSGKDNILQISTASK